MRLFEDTKVYILCPGNIHTGGPELLHQLCSQLIKYGIDAYMLYNPFSSDNPIDDFYAKYRLPYTLEVEDVSHNIIIIHETAPECYFWSKNLQKVFWWLSVDNYIGHFVRSIYSWMENPIVSKMPRMLYWDNLEKDTDHWTQSEYAKQFIILNDVPEKNIYMVEDYINQAFLTQATKIDFSKKANIVAYNPSKGFEFTKRLIETAPKINWIPIQNMTPEQVQALLAVSKVYIDFGNHPGKDRIPREAALSGCVVITGKRGAAGNDIDINIPAEFKFDENVKLKLIIDKIRDIFTHFRLNYAKQETYRKRILDDKNRFEKQVAAAFNINPNFKREFYAIPQGLTDEGYTLAKILPQSDLRIKPTFVIDDRFYFGKNFSATQYV